MGGGREATREQDDFTALVSAVSHPPTPLPTLPHKEDRTTRLLTLVTRSRRAAL